MAMTEIKPDAWYWPLTDRVFVRSSDTEIERKWLDVVDPHSFPNRAGLKEPEDYDQIEPLYSAQTILSRMSEIASDNWGGKQEATKQDWKNAWQTLCKEMEEVEAE